MGIINYKADPMQLTGSKIESWNGSVTDWLIRENLNPAYIDVYINGELIPNPDYINQDSRLFSPLSEFDSVNIVSTPKGTGLLYAAIAVVASVAVSFLLAPAINPNNSGVVQESPNNTLQAQTNQPRPYQGIPDIYGEPIPYPDLSGEATQEYIEQDKGQAQKTITQLMSVSVETYEVDEVFTSKTLLSQIGGSYTVYQPQNKQAIVPLVRETFSINEIDGQELFAQNQVEAQFSRVANVVQSTDNRVENVAGDEYMLYTNANLSGITDVTLPALGEMVLQENVPNPDPNGIDGVIQYESNITVNAVTQNAGSYEISFTSSNQTVVNQFEKITITLNEQTTIGPFSSETDGSQLWVDFVFPRGLKGTAEVRVDYEIEGATGNVSDSVTYTFTKDSFDSQFFTRKLVSTVGAGKWTVSFTRINDVGGTENPSQVKLERVATIREIQNKNYGNVTLIEVVVPATLQATSLRENKINLRGGRMVIGYNRATGEVDYTLRRSRSGADHILHEYVSVFGKSPDDLDLDALYDIYDNLSDPRLGYFDWTFDDLNVSLGQRIQTIANAARIYLIPTGSKYTFRRDELQMAPSTILTRRDIAKNRTYKYSYKPQMNSDRDSVRVEYVDSSNNTKAFIELKYDETSGQFVEGVGSNPLKIELPCCKEEYNAMNRAQLEIRKLYYLRENISDTFLTGNANLIEQGELIRYEEVYNDSVIGGEVRSFSGAVINLSESVPDGSDLVFEFVNNSGRKSEQLTFTKTGPKQITLNSAPSGMFQPTVNNAKGSSYIISTTTTLSELEYISGAPSYANDGKTVQLTLNKHDSRVYEYDEV
ncbi:MAG: hypothetical protein GY928_36405 [Colwellia sp.]|nr:hypothetical protein [Colwellia sp.]